MDIKKLLILFTIAVMAGLIMGGHSTQAKSDYNIGDLIRLQYNGHLCKSRSEHQCCTKARVAFFGLTYLVGDLMRCFGQLYKVHLEGDTYKIPEACCQLPVIRLFCQQEQRDLDIGNGDDLSFI